jgi:pyruvate formate lyase activating enzyme
MAEARDKALIFEVKGNSLDDGPGIRTVVFFKGCPLSCVWCHNPESKKPRPEIKFDREKCVGCGSCLKACAAQAITPGSPHHVDREKCTLCADCARECPSTALSMVGASWTLDELTGKIEKDIPFFEASGGGITLSGGEPTMYMDFASSLLGWAKSRGIGTLVETCGLFPLQRFLDTVYPHGDIFYFDLKLFDPRTHKTYCGVDNGTILENFTRLHDRCRADGKTLLPRIPLIPGITATEENLRAIADFLKRLGVGRVELLPNNPLWLSKLEPLGSSSPLSVNAEMKDWMSLARVEECRGFFSGLEVR